MKRALALIPVALFLACVPARPPIYVVTLSPAERLQAIHEANFEVMPLGKVDLHDFKRAFVKRYGSQEAFVEVFQKDLGATLAQGGRPEAAAYRVELPALDVDSHTVGYWTTMGGGPNMPPQQVYHSTEYCDIRLDYKVIGPDNQVLLDGQVKESTAKAEFLHPNQSKLANAVEGLKQHLVDYLRGRMPAENIGSPQAPPVK